jgi:3-hydroxybutyryl-CoA dehydrogenase
MSLVIATWGAGRMGRGIAHSFAFAGHDCWLIDSKSRSTDALQTLRAIAIGEIQENLNLLMRLGLLTSEELIEVMTRVRFVSFDEAADVLPKVDVVFEGVPEILATKQAAFAYLSTHLRPDCIVASTTSTMLSTALANFVSYPERFLNAHWLNPAYLIPLVEVSPHAGTAGAVLDALTALLKSIGKKPVVCKPVPGFIVPRLQALVMNEAARMIEEGVASAEDIDQAIRYGFGPRYASMGVVEFIDVGGLDILYYASQYLSVALNDSRFAAPAIVNRYMQEGRLGLKTGQGFFQYKNADQIAYRNDVMQRQVAMLKHLGLLPQLNQSQSFLNSVIHD